MTNLSLARVYGILNKNIKLGNINARWIHQLFSDEQKRVRVENAKKLLKCI